MSPRRGFTILEGEEDLVKVESEGSRTDDDSTLELVGSCVEAAILYCRFHGNRTAVPFGITS